MRSRIIFFVALIAILVGGYGIYDSVLKNKDKSSVVVNEIAPQPKKDSVEYITVWRTLNNIDRGESIANDALKREQMLLTDALDEGLRSDVELDFSPSTLFNRDLPQGALILPEYITRENDPGYIDLLVTEGMTLYPLVVSNKNLISDFIRPGERIDILTVSSPSSNLSGAIEKPIRFKGVTATLFLQNIKVLNMGGEDSEQKLKPVAGKSEDGFTTIIIEIPPTEVARLALAQRTMHLEVYRSREYEEPVYADVRNVMSNYIGIEEMRGSKNKNGREGEL
ncbi:Flp pilus assembly protein CpaB [Vibrio sp. ZSDZ65]|uniref:Flp pilus assembly protein CpaB n=1 Tax=Vibrio qingdaonensis TaxID=2829491 RepID=A0A9X3CJB9_9VIBR|nr:Flp pilus assembly protein CpaB [Vibrio qingdaonensis]MCW8344518.1 Flp pilus assembly protein CpaB [Vibrio qingdaonensis]